MNRYIFIIFLLSILYNGNAQNYQYRNVHAIEFDNLSKTQPGSLLDVRTPSEFANGHIKNAGQLNYYSLQFKQKLLLLPSDQPVYLYCNTGYRSKKAAEILIKNGYTNVYNLEQGIMEWDLRNLPVDVEPDAQPDTENKMAPDEYLALINSDQAVFIDFYAPWCAPCRKMMPMIDSLKVAYKDRITIVKINADASKRLIKELQLSGVPYLSLYKKGQKLFEHSGIIERNKLETLFKQQ